MHLFNWLLQTHPGKACFFKTVWRFLWGFPGQAFYRPGALPGIKLTISKH